MNSTEGDVPTRLARYQAEREIEALKLQSAARNRMTWFEDVERYVGMEPEQFAFRRADRQPARRPCQPEAARPGLHRRLRPLVRREMRRAVAPGGADARRCSRPSSCAA
jgi:hypothetical protein